MEAQHLTRSAPPAEAQGIKLIFELTNLCNFSCTHCIREEGGDHQFLPLEIIDKVLKDAQAYRNVNFVALTGGEPTLHPHFVEILRRLVGFGYRFGFVTNGWRFTQTTYPLLQPFRDHLSHVTFSIDGASEETHDTLRRREGSFRRLMEAVTLCRFSGIAFHINFVVTLANRGEVERMAMLASRLGCEILLYGHCQPTPDAVAADLVMDVQERRAIEREVAELQRVFRMKILLAGDHYNPSPFYQCPQLQMRELNVDYLGRLTACCMLSNYRGGTPDTDVIADLAEVSLYEAHKRLMARILKINLEKIERLSTGGDLAEKDLFICSHCLEHYDKLPDHHGILALPVIGP